MSAVEGWQPKHFHELGTLLSGSTPPTTVPSYWDGEIVWVTPNDLSKLNTPYLTDSAKKITAKGLKGCSAQLLPSRSIVISSRAPIGYVAIPSVEFCTNQGCKSIKLKDAFDPEFTYYNILFNIDRVKNLGEGTTFAEISKATLSTVRIDFPTSKPEQTKIAEVLSAVDRAIEQTEALIAKQQRIKTGLMQDLLTCGIDELGNLRSEETHEFKDSPLGRIPVEWEVRRLGELITSAVDGPFGSNLKTEHYVDEPGVRVIRLQNIGNGEFIDTDRVWVSQEHARKLDRHSVTAGDILIGSLGDDKRLFGRACLYSDSAQPAIVKADVFRVRCKRGVMDHGFAFRLFNLPRWRRGLYGLVQGVTRDRVNLSNLMLLELPVPNIEEQRLSASYLNAVDKQLHELQVSLDKLRSLKTALMQDLLTGEKRVTPLLEAG